MPVPEVIRSERFAESITISVPSETRRSRAESKFVFGPSKTHPDASERLNIAERFAWAGGCLTRFAAQVYLGDVGEARRRLETAYAYAPHVKPALSESEIRILFDLPQRQAIAEGRDNLDSLPGLSFSFTAEAGRTFKEVGRKLQDFSKLEGTAHADLSDTNSDYFVDRFTRRHTPTSGVHQGADEVTMTILTSRSPDVQPHYITDTAFSGNGRDVQARFSYTAKLSSSREVSSLLTVTGNLTHGPDDFRYQDTTFASLVVAGMRLQGMGMHI